MATLPDAPARRGRAGQRLLRVKTGCLPCRTRKKKCDERKPICGGCTRNCLNCTWPQPARPKEKQQCNTKQRDDASAVDTHSSTNQSSSSSSSSNSSPAEAVVPDADLGVAFDNTGSPTEHHDQPGEHETLNFNPTNIVSQTDWSPPGDALSIPFNLSLLPCHGHNSFELLAHYLSRTANSMGNGSTDANPFVVQLIPLAFSSDLILQLLLAQSAAHRAILDSMEPAKDAALTYYSKSLRLFRKSLSNSLSWDQQGALTLGIGALIMCFTETARGDIHGALFDHLKAASSILVDTLCTPNLSLPKALEDFLVQYYTYTATLSMISIDPKSENGLDLSPKMERLANELVARGYIGQLCSCWLELILLIPRILNIGQRYLAVHSGGEARISTPDDMLSFATLYAQIEAFSPNPCLGLSMEVILASYIYQQAMLLYLLTAISPLEIDDAVSSGIHHDAIQQALTTAISYLVQLSPADRINTSLCWPLAIIGSCVTDQNTQDILRNRLHFMFQSIGLGNIEKTLTLLEHMWARPMNKRGPWSIWKVMQEEELRTSFA